MVLPVRCEDVALGVDGDALEALELGVGRAPAAEAPQEGPVGVEDLDPVVAAVGHENVALLVHGDAPESQEKEEMVRKSREKGGRRRLRSAFEFS